jgi:uncharacterized protein
MRQAGEPSVEEILDSIKKVIARDNRAAAAEKRRERESAGVQQEPAMDDREEDEVLDLAEADEWAEDPVEVHMSEEEEPPLVTEDARVSMQHSLEALTMLAEPGARPQIVRSGETSLEGLVRDMLRPMLADWLDKNLPPMVERMVAAEISRIIGKRG